MKITLLLKHHLSLKSLAYYEIAALMRTIFRRIPVGWVSSKTEPSRKKKKKEEKSTKKVKRVRNICDDECIFKENWTNHFCMTWNSTLSNTKNLCDQNNQSLLLLKRMRLSFAWKSIWRFFSCFDVELLWIRRFFLNSISWCLQEFNGNSSVGGSGNGNGIWYNTKCDLQHAIRAIVEYFSI